MKDKEYYIPKYYRISREIIAKIQNGELLPGMKIPSENELIKKYQLSNTTARKILQEIENAGWAIKVKGKGTFVRTQNVERSVTRILGFNKNMLEAGHVPSTRLIDAQVLQNGHTAVISGRRYFMKGPIYKIERLRFADHIPMMFEERYISVQFCPDIEEQNFESSLFDVYEKVYGFKLSAVNQMLSTIIITNSRIKSFFEIEQPIPALVVEGVTFCGREMILEMEKAIYRGDKYRFSVRAT